MIRLSIKSHHFDIKKEGDLFTLYKITKFTGGEQSQQILGSANIKQIKQKVIKVSHSNKIEVSEKLKEVGL